MNHARTARHSGAPHNSAPDITRTFSPFRESETQDTDFEFWFEHASERGLTWDALLKKRLVVVLGEAGIGKTYEFRQQAQRLRSEEKAAFFIPLNSLERQEDWEGALNEQAAWFEKWKGGTATGIFFLDAVDEARLTGPTALQRALACVRRALTGHLNRVSFVVSSRISDWNMPTVRALVAQQIALPVNPPSAPAALNNQTTIPDAAASGESVPLEVYSLNPLSVEAAKRLAAYFGVVPVDAFWQEVVDGNYRFLATRPLDLEWMAVRWQHAGKLGSYAEIIEAAVTNRLVEKNSGYVDAGAVLSSDQLRRGAESLAVASILSGASYLQVEPGTAPSGVIAPGEVLLDWKPNEHQRLLGSALFDEATYGRVQFHHRAVREYLAAWWVKRQLDAGLPFSEAWALFARAPYGEEVLIPSRRAVLCWLAALDARVRGRVIRSFPEMVIFEGDPQQWSVDDVVESFEAYLIRLKSGYRPDWWNDSSEFRRVALAIPASALSRWIEANRDDPKVLPKLLTLVTHGRVTSCADQVFALYRRTGVADRLQRYLLDTLAVVATTEHRTCITEDLLLGKLAGNDLIAEGIKAVGLARLSVAQLAACFGRTAAESEYGGGSLATAVKAYLLPEATLAEATKLLEALVSALPTLNARELIECHEPGERRETWMLSVLPDVLLKVLELAPLLEPTKAEATLVIDAAVMAEKLRHTVYANDEDFRNLRAALARHSKIRKIVALRVAHSSDILHAVSTLTWMSGVVYLGRDDLEWLVPCANDAGCVPADRTIWYHIARDISFMHLRGVRRRIVLNQLVAGPDADARRTEIQDIASQRIKGVRQRRAWKHEEFARKRAARDLDASNKATLLKQIEEIRCGSSFGGIHWLVLRASERGGRSRYTSVSVDVIYREFGPKIGRAFDDGLARAWRYIDAPDFTKYLDNSVPWAGLIGLASANHAFRTGLDVATLAENEVEKLVRLCVWELDQLEAWFALLVETRLAEVTRALAPWFAFDLSRPDDNSIRRTADMVLGGPQPLKQALLPIAIQSIESGTIPSERLRRKLLSEIVAANLAGPDLVGKLARESLVKGLATSPQTFDVGWFSDWVCADFVSAWGWFEKNHRARLGTREGLIESVAQALDASSEVWKRLTGEMGTVSALVRLWRFVDTHANRETHSNGEISHPSSPGELLDRIAAVLSNLPGRHAHQALADLASGCAGTSRGEWLAAKAREQAARNAEDAARVSPSNLPAIGEPFTREPRTETELFDQVVARLAEITESVEKGPFSERGLFPAGILEKQLQLWLAARLEDTPRRRFTARFSVTREPTVDADKRADIEVSTKAGKVCIEIKLLDTSRGYSARSLTEDTLNQQLVGQYLRGKNSHHGVLLVFRLDRKTWQIPGIEGYREFGELVDYLRQQAQAIVANDHHIMRLEVLPIDCTART